MSDSTPEQRAPNTLSLTLRYVGVLASIGLLAGLIFWISYPITLAQQVDAKLITQSAEQRTLTVEAVLLATQISNTPPSPHRDQVKEQLRAVVERLERRNNALAYGNLEDGSHIPILTEAEAVFFGGADNLTRDMRVFIESAYSVMDDGAEKAEVGPLQLQTMWLVRDRISRRLDDVVTIYQRYTEQKIARLKAIQIAGLFAILAVLIMSAFGVFRPMVDKIVRSFKALFQTQEELEIRNVDLELAKSQYERLGAELAEMSEDLAAARDKAEEARHAMGRFMSSMSHELRTPLNAILGFSEFMGMNKGELTPKQEEGLGIIHDCGEHLLDLINELLDLSKLEAGVMTLDMRRVKPRHVIDECLVLVGNQASKSAITIEDRTKGNVIPPVEADPMRLKQVLLNLMTNAIKYNSSHGFVRLSCEDAGEKVLIKVADTGIGLSDDQIANLFTPFYRVGAENTNIEGTGLGLVITQKLVEAMGGEITVSAVQGEGCTFSVALNKAAPESADVSGLASD